MVVMPVLSYRQSIVRGVVMYGSLDRLKTFGNFLGKI